MESFEDYATNLYRETAISWTLHAIKIMMGYNDVRNEIIKEFCPCVQNVEISRTFDGDPYSSWGGFTVGSIYFDTGLNALQLYLGSTVGSTFSGSTWCSVLTDCSGYTGGLSGVTALGATGLSYGATLTSDRYLQLGSATSTNPGLMTAIGQTFSGDKYFNGFVGVSGLFRLGNYSSSPSP